MMKNRLFRRLPAFLALTAMAACSLDGMTGPRATMAQLPERTVAEPGPGNVAADAYLAALVAQQPDQAAGTVSSSVSPSSSATRTTPARRVVPTAKYPAVPSGTYNAVAADPSGVGRTLLETSSKAKAYRNITLAEDTVWSGEVHVLGWVTVPAQVTLTIEPGTVIRFKPDRETIPGGAGLLVQGRLTASGRSENPILFSGGYAKAAAGDWQGVVLLASDKKNLIEECRVEGAVSGIEVLHSQLTLREVVASNCVTGFRFRDSFVVIAGGGVSGSRLGVHAVDSELEIRDASISSNRQGVVSSAGSLYLSGTTLYGNEEIGISAESLKLKVSGSSFTVNGLGLRLSGCEGTVSQNRMLNNRDAGLELVDSRLKVTGNEIAQNSKVGVRVSSGGTVFWGNSIFSNNSHDLEYTGSSELVAMANWWGDIPLDSIPSRIRRAENSGNVLYAPVLMQRPQPAF